jgi:hypothetical protein
MLLVVVETGVEANLKPTPQKTREARVEEKYFNSTQACCGITHMN